MKKALVLFLLIFIVYGCTSIRLSSNYSPSILLEGEGKVKIHQFIYKPYDTEIDNDGNIYKYEKYYDSVGTESKHKTIISPYEIKTFGLNKIFLDKPISDFITEAVKKELKFIGYKNSQDAPVTISGIIQDVSIDYIGYTNVTYITKIEFIIKDDDKEIYRKTSEGKYISIKFSTLDFTPGFYSSVAKAIEDFIRQAQGEGCL